eukprot:1140542-Prorocentrum_lima.AAC.1
MTSSLVGSEMCIRDRIWDMLPHQLGPTMSTQREHIMKIDVGDGLSVRAVSYTHLTLPTICSV